MTGTKGTDPVHESFFPRLTNTLRAIGVFWPSVALVAIFFLLFCCVDVGRDLVLLARDARWPLPFALIALVFASFTVWYSGRLVGFFHLKVLTKAKPISIHLPRFMGFSTFTVLACAVALPPMAWLSAWYAVCLVVVVLAGFGWYYLLVHWARTYAKKHQDATHVRRGSALVVIGTLVACACSGLSSARWAIIGCILMAQLCYTLQVAARNQWAPLLNATGTLTAAVLRWRLPQRMLAAAKRRLKAQGVQDEVLPKLKVEVVFFTAFNVIATIALALFVAADANLAFARFAQPLPIAITGFAVVLGMLNLVRLAGQVWNVNVLFWTLLFSFFIGMFFDAHQVRVVREQHTHIVDQGQRPAFATAAADWMNARLAQAAADSLSRGTAKIPMVLVLSDGGGARSARWVTHVLGRLDSLSQGRFREHLFSLSGASGGSVGNVTYYGLLCKGTAPDSIGRVADRVTGADLLSFTLARMLGNDLLNLICPALGHSWSGNRQLLDDRAAAVEDGLIDAGGTVGLALDTPITNLMRHQGNLPLLCINTTRVQDARPAVISSFDLTNDSAFSGRLDLLAKLVPGQSLSAASSAVLSARFPYVTPGGSLRMRGPEGAAGGTQERTELFVDGGYFDNSGAGLVLEMLVELEHNPKLRQLFKQFRPVVIHISNGDNASKEPERVNSVVNDLFAPVVTIIGAYGEQTDVNNQRLARYLRNNGDPWVELNLFMERTQHQTPEYYPMSWVMSQVAADSMQVRAWTHPDVQLWGERMRAW